MHKHTELHPPSSDHSSSAKQPVHLQTCGVAGAPLTTDLNPLAHLARESSRVSNTEEVLGPQQSLTKALFTTVHHVFAEAQSSMKENNAFCIKF